MGQLVVLNLGRGNWQQGFPSVIAQLWEAGRAPMQFTGSLPAAPDLENLYRQWRSLYEALYAGLNWRQSPAAPVPEIEIIEDDVTNVSETEFFALCRELQVRLNGWLDAREFRKIDRSLRTRLHPGDEVRLIITAEDNGVLRLPWCLWQFLEDYPNAEIALSPFEYRRSIKSDLPRTSDRVRILAVLGNAHGIDTEHDRQLLKALPHAELSFLVEPDLATLNQHLWGSSWDILFFAGHSSSHQGGQMQLNATESISIEQLRYGLKQAIANGLKLAIFNSCDGLELAHDLADLHIPQVIVMREPVPDRVAQEFLTSVLPAFASGQSLYKAVRQAREHLQTIEHDFPCATWLPVVCQNPAEEPVFWKDWCVQPSHLTPATTPWQRWTKYLPSRRQVWQGLAASLAITGAVLGVRWMGWLEPLELRALDHLLQVRPHEEPDPRLLIITVDEADIQAQGQDQRRSSLSDATLTRLLEELEQADAQVIGLDVYRDFPVDADQPQLANQLRESDRLIAVCKSRDAEVDSFGVAPPPEVPKTRLGFSDFLKDEDGVLRRHLLSMTPDPLSPCATAYSFSSQIAFTYLHAMGISAQFTPTGNLQIGETEFPRLRDRSGGYQSIDAGGNQILLNYRALPHPDKIGDQVTLTQFLQNPAQPNSLRGKVVLIGVTAVSAGDYWATPYGSDAFRELSGVFVQAHMVSQILSAVLDGRSLLWVWSGWQEGLWILGWALVGGGLALCLSPRQVVIGAIGGGAVLYGTCVLLITQGGWVPLIPAAVAFATTTGMVVYLKNKSFSTSGQFSETGHLSGVLQIRK
ncbi:CHASE2 domain-containing protein [Oscillatoria sp. FACHB-1407]|uniref:CHASE2 domain-containing protein n=1 Tax=Oscillatoria sp. FACHB-1407 TaxID=2692847 RepID=UPI00168300A3|nr:CHASE2 domain-containing protein [Oscillatoria sp. FACHB-1407]MBD2459788.1 CHASE2 domain-containing protein [Oscillatoria sp. FACHB-1407]